MPWESAPGRSRARPAMPCGGFASYLTARKIRQQETAMTDVDADARRIRDAFEHDLAGYHAPADLAERARAGGLRRARRRRIQLAASMAAATCATVVTGLVIVPLTAPSGGG